MRVRTRAQYQRIAQKSKRHVGYWIILDVRQNHQSLTKLGITASRHYGGAVDRNRFKRMAREAFRLSYPQLPAGFDLNLKPRHTARQAKSTDIQKELLRLLTV